MMGLAQPVPARGTLRVLAALLAYPDARVRGHLPEMRDILRAESALGGERLAQVEALIDTLAVSDPFETEARYVQMFDCGRSTSLHLFEHVHGDSRDRGPAMVDLVRTYEAAGLFLAPGELPDYLPVVLEFASTQPPREARAFLGEVAHIVDGLHAALARRGSPYAALVAALVELAGETVHAPKPEAAPEPALDEAWDEPPAFGGCPAPARPGEPQPIHIIRSAKPGVAA